MLVFGIQYLDRQIVIFLSQSIKRDFGLSDTQIGLLAGIIFSVPFSAMLIPAGWLVDRINRRSLLALALAVWSCLTACTGLVRSLHELLLVRVLIAAAELPTHPTQHS